MLNRVGVLQIVLVLLLASPAVMAEDAPSAAPAVAAAQAAGVVTPDTEIFKRTPMVDGVISDGEWDTHYSYSTGDWQVTTYADWDSTSIYIGARSSKPFDLLGVLDANADGWFHGDENYEFKATRADDGGLVLAVARYESRNTKSPVASPVSAAEAAMVEMKSTKSGDYYTIEMRMPQALIRGYKLAPGKNIGFRIAVKTAADESGWIPSNEIGDVKECTLVNKKAATLKPLEVGFDLEDPVVARGEDLMGRFHLTNSGAETIDAKSFVIAGEGKAGDYLGSQKVRIEGLAPKQHIAQNVRTLIPSDMPVGSWAIGAEVLNGENRLGAALVSFDVVDPFDAELRLPANDVKADVKDVTFSVLIRNNCRRNMRGTAKITLPVGWELWRGIDARDFQMAGSGASSVSFKAKPPIGEMGVVPVKLEVTSGRETKMLEGKVTIVNP